MSEYIFTERRTGLGPKTTVLDTNRHGIITLCMASLLCSNVHHHVCQAHPVQ